MKIKQQFLNKSFKIFTIILLLIGGFIRLLTYLQNRSLFMDEANLARNIVEKSIIDLFGSLEYGQYAPPLFSAIQKINLWCFGVNEFAFRLLPLLSGLLFLFLFYQLVCFFIKTPAIRWFPVFLVALSPFFIRYSTEVKQYMTDGMVALLLVWLAVRDSRNTPEASTGQVISQRNSISATSLWQWSLIGAIAIWFSMTSVFVLAGIALYFVAILARRSFPSTFSIFRLKHLNEKVVGNDRLNITNEKVLGNNHLGMLQLSIIFISWLFSFGLYFYFILWADIQKDNLQDYHQVWFPPFVPSSIEEMGQWWVIVRSILRTTIGYTGLALGLGIVSLLSGIIFFIKRKKLAVVLLLTPIITCWIASCLQFYSLIPRLTLFFIPFLIIIIGVGLEWIFKNLPKWGKPFFVLILILVASLQKGYEYFWQPLQVSEIKPLLEDLSQEYQEDDILFVDNETVAAFDFYTRLHQKYKDLALPKNIYYAQWDDLPSAEKLSLENQNNRRIWFLYTHLMSTSAQNKMKQEFNQVENYANLIKERKALAACLRLYKTK